MIGALERDIARVDEEQLLTPRSAAALAAALIDARKYTLAIYAHLTDAQRQVLQQPAVNPPQWELGHLGWFQERWCRRYRPEDPQCMQTPSRIVSADALWDSSNVPHGTRWTLPLPDWDAILAYIDGTLEDTLEALAISRDGERYFFELALYHEDMHAEALLMTLQTLALPAPTHLCTPTSVSAMAIDGDVVMAGGEFEIGTSRDALSQRFVFDNEKWAHRVCVAPFAVARRCVTNAEFAAFVDAGGYLSPALWCDDGRRWLAISEARAPATWRRRTKSSGGSSEPWQVRRFDRWVPLDADAAIQHVNAFEATAYCRWAQRRLPTEMEWEYAARHGLPVHTDDRPWANPLGNANLDLAHGAPVSASAFAQSATSGLAQMLGNVWEWTSTPFHPYPGFAPDPYADYSAPWFGDHHVLRGGSWATRSRLVHHRFRNFYRPERTDPFAGFRTCATV